MSGCNESPKSANATEAGNERSDDQIRAFVRENYGKIAEAGEAGCGCAPTDCCTPALDQQEVSQALGYSAEELASLPEGANLGLGCGNPQAIAKLQEGEVAVDLGSGGGIDCFLAAQRVGEKGRVIGIDMTPTMLSKARENAKTMEADNVEFRLGEIEYLPIGNDEVDVIISNCVINLSPDKGQVFRDAYRVLKPGGRLAISDVVATAEIPEELRGDLSMHSACISGAVSIDALTAMLNAAGFESVAITPKDESKEFIRTWAPGTQVAEVITSAHIEAIKPIS
jgi:arsenite methyltransferase